MTIEEHCRAAEHHLTEAFHQLKRSGKAEKMATMPLASRTIAKLLDSSSDLIHTMRVRWGFERWER